MGFTLSNLKISREKVEGVPRKQQKIVYKTKQRNIKIASHKDSAIYTYYGKYLSALYERCLARLSIENVATAFRSLPGGKCNIDHAKEVFDFIHHHRPCVALAFDVEKFFDTLSHTYLRERWADLLEMPQLPPDHYQVYRSLTRFAWVSRQAAYNEFGISEHNPKLKKPNPKRTRICSIDEFRSRIRASGLIQHNPRNSEGQVRGIPQGSPMSAVLSNIYMLKFDTAMHGFARSIGGLYRRYCDDIMLIVPPEFEECGKIITYSNIQQLEIKCNEDKTEIVRYLGGNNATEKALQYLGFTYDGQAVRLRQSSLDRYYGKMRKGVRFAVKCQNKAIKKSGSYQRLRKRKLLTKYTHFAQRQRGVNLRHRTRKYNSKNFITYGIKAAKIFESPAIKKQIRRHWGKLHKQISKKEIQPESKRAE